jgi:hypothetical protein
MATIPAARILRDVASVPEDAGVASRARIRRQALELVEQEGLLAAVHASVILPLDRRQSETLCVGGEAFHAPWLLPEAGELTALALSVCSVGPAIEARVRSLFAERRASLALGLDMLGNELLFAVSRRAQDSLLAEAKRGGLSMAGELRPGDPGLALEAQAGLLRLTQAESIGVTIGGHDLLTPMKSTTAIFGVGRDLPPARWSRCDRCPSRKGCRVAQQQRVASV